MGRPCERTGRRRRSGTARRRGGRRWLRYLWPQLQELTKPCPAEGGCGTAAASAGPKCIRYRLLSLHIHISRPCAEVRAHAARRAAPKCISGARDWGYSFARSSHVLPLRTLPGCSATMSEPGRAWSSRVLTKIQRRSPVRVKANSPASLC